MTEAVSLTDAQIEGLLSGYIERKRFEAKVLIGTLGEAMKPKDQGQGISLGMLSSMGFGIRGA